MALTGLERGLLGRDTFMTDSTVLSDEQRELLSTFTTPPPPVRRTRRKGSRRVAAVLNAMLDLGLTSATTWDIEARLRALRLWDDLWPKVVSTDGASKTLGDLLGAHGLKLGSTPGKKGEPRRYMIPKGGISSSYCETNAVELVDDPTTTAPIEPDEHETE